MSYENIQGRHQPFVTRYFADIISYRHLAMNLVGADLRARFRRSYLGILWAIIQPLCFSILIGWVWGSLFNYPSVWDYALYIFSGLIVWEYFATVMNVSQDALTSAEGYLKQTRIPFLIFQIRTAMTGMVVLWAGAIGLVLMQFVLMQLGLLHEPPVWGPYLFLLPPYFVILFLFMAPLAIVMSILGTQIRDLKYVTMLAVQALFFISPVMLDRKLIDSEKMQVLNIVNPMSQLLHMFRQIMTYGEGWRQEQIVTVLAWGSAFWAIAIFLSIRSGRRLVYAL